MFNRELFDLLVLSILEDAQNSTTKDTWITAYQITKRLQEKFGGFWSPSPGTIYPILQKFTESKDVETKSDAQDPKTKLYRITDTGIKKLHDNTETFMQTSLEFIPKIFESLGRFVPEMNRLRMYAEIPSTDLPSSFCACGGKHDWDKDVDADDIPSTQQIKRLERMKEKLEAIKQRIQEQSRARMAAIDERIKNVDEALQKLRKDRESGWKKIPIEDADK
jgi:DNA-binding PadR family transcriptional regulator